MPIEANTKEELLRLASERFSDASALVSPGRLPLTYSQLYAQIADTVHTLNDLGIGRGHRVAMVTPNTVEAATLMAAVEACATVVTCSPALTLAESTALMSRLKVSAVIIPDGLETSIWQAAQELGLRVITQTLIPDALDGSFRLSSSIERPPIPFDSEAGGFSRPDDIAFLLLTSATTAASKIVPITQQACQFQIRLAGESLELTERDRMLSMMPLSNGAGRGALSQSLGSGGCAMILPGFEVKTFFHYLQEFQPTWFAGVATMYQAILDQAPNYTDMLENSPLRLTYALSMVLDAARSIELEKVLKAPIFQAYGSTEAGMVAGTPLPPKKRKPGSVGLPAKGLDVALIDDKGNFLPQGDTGEVVVRGPTMTGYEDDPQATAEAFINSWYRMGDLGYLDEDGYLFIVGRVKEVINRGGQKISPGEIEQVLLAHPQVAQAAAFAMPDPRLGDEVAAAVVLRAPGSITEATLREFASASLASYKVPRRIVFIDDIPKNPVGKPLRLGLAQKLGLTAASATSGEFALPRTEFEKRLAQLWVETLGCKLEQVGINTRFADLGGVSLSAAHLIFRARQAFGVQVTILDLFDAPTIAQQAAVIEKLTQKSQPRASSYLIPIQPKGSRPPLYCLHAVEGGVYIYQNLVPYLDADQPIYGLLAVGMDDGSEPYATVDEMARHHYQQIKAVQLDGPYFLCGYSFGGRLALETARLLYEEGHTDTYALVIDDLLQSSAWNHYPVRKKRTFMDRLETLRFAMMELEPVYRALYIRQRLQHYWRRLRKSQPLSERRQYSVPPTVQRVTEAATEAGRRYVPRRYDGDACYLYAIENEVNIPLFKTLRYIGSDHLAIRNVPGNHRELFSPPYIETVGREVQRWLSEKQTGMTY